MPIRAVIFDLGGVLVRMEDFSEHRKWENQLGLTEGELLKTIFGSEIGYRTSIGQASVAEMWQYVATTFGLNAEQVRELEHDFWLSEKVDAELVMFLRNLRPLYKTAILSNAWPDARMVFTQKFSLHDAVDEIIISAEEGIAKPDARIYQIAAERLGVQPSEAIFVDDWPKSVQGASSAGMHAIQFRTTGQVIAEVQKYLDNG